MNFQLLSKLVTLNDLERVIMALIVRYFAKFGGFHMSHNM